MGTVTDINIQESEVETRRQCIVKCQEDILKSFLMMGSFLKQAKVNRDWEFYHLSGFSEYVEEFHLSVSQAYRLIQIYEVFHERFQVPYERLLSIGQSRLEAVLPRAKRATEETIEVILDDAERFSVKDLSPHGELPELKPLICKGCGEEVKCKKCGEGVMR